MKRTPCGAIVAATSLVMVGSALAEGVQVEVPVTAIDSWDEFGEPTNTVLTLDVADLAGFGSGQAVVLTGIGFDLTLETFMFSWLSEAEINLDDSVTPAGGLTLNPGDGMDFSGTMNYVQPLMKLDAADQVALGSGLLRIEFYESFDDIPGVPDAQWNGTITVQIDLPAPGAAALIGCGCLALFRRRR